MDWQLFFNNLLVAFSVHTRRRKLHPTVCRKRQEPSGKEVRFVNTATTDWQNAETTKKRKWWQVLLRWVLNRIIDRIGGKLFDRYVWPYLVKIANSGWAMVKAAIAFLKVLLLALWKLFHAKAAGGAATSGVKAVVMTCCKCAVAAAA